MATKLQSASCTNENIPLFLSCYRFPVFYGSSTASKHHNNQQRHPTSKPMNSAFYYYYQWEQEQLARWEYEQELADNDYNQTNTEELSDDLRNL
jgi:hypothetical protein